MSIKKIHYTRHFSVKALRLPYDLKSEIDKKETIFRNDPFDPRLKTHKLKGKLKGLWSFSLTFQHRVLFEFVNKNEVLFFDIGGHEIYN